MSYPLYRSHKHVRAVKIARAEFIHDTGTGLLTFEDATFPQLVVSADYMRKHAPLAGGYYVVYDDGYTSFSPAAPFEAGYARVTEETLV